MGGGCNIWENAWIYAMLPLKYVDIHVKSPVLKLLEWLNVIWACLVYLVREIKCWVQVTT